MQRYDEATTVRKLLYRFNRGVEKVFTVLEVAQKLQHENRFVFVHRSIHKSPKKGSTAQVNAGGELAAVDEGWSDFCCFLTRGV